MRKWVALTLALWVGAWSNGVAASDVLPPTFDVNAVAQEAQALTRTGHAPALGVAIVHRGQPRLAQAWGVTKHTGGKPVDSHTVFRLASVSKGFTSAAAGLAIEDGALRWDSPATQWAPHGRLGSKEATDKLTLAAILSQQTGLEPYNYGDRALQNGASKDTLDAMVANARMKCLPGRCYSYQNVTYQWAADMISVATNVPFETFVETRLFKPLGMEDASFGLDGLQQSGSWAEPHVGMKTVTPQPTYYLLPAAAGVNASTADLVHWLAAQTGHRSHVLSPQLLEIVHTPRASVPPFTSGWRKERVTRHWYGLGWRVWDYRGVRVIMHAGAVQGYRSLVAMVPVKDFAVALVWNSQSAEPAKLLPKILDGVLDPNMILAEPSAAPLILPPVNSDAGQIEQDD